MSTHTNLTEQQLITLCSQITLTNPQTIVDNEWVFRQYNAPMPLVYQSFVMEFTSLYINDIKYRHGLHTLCSEVYQAAVN